MISMTSRNAFGGFSFAAFSTYNIPIVVAVMINPSLIESSMFFSNQSYLFIVYFSKAYDVVLVVDLVFHWLFFIIFRLESVICKKYTNTNGNKYT